MNWYKLSQAYEQFRSQVEQESQQNTYPFKNWFNEQGRVYIPFSPLSVEQNQTDTNVEKLLTENGCKITDYRGGYCQSGNRVYRIGKFLEQLRKKQLQAIREQHQKEEIYNLERALAETNKYFNDIINEFINSPIRIKKGEEQFFVVISQNPHDVAQMSTDRSWTSCMELGSGSQHKNIFCEVREGGLVAYLINKNDLDIENPLARIHIRRFSNKDGQSVAIPEDSVYGNEVAGFSQIVKKWLDSKQGDIQPGVYSRQGGEWSDTFSDRTFVGPADPKEVIKWFKGEVEGSVYSEWEVRDALNSQYKEFVDAVYRDDDGNYYTDDIDEIGDYEKIFKSKEEAELYLEKMKQEDKKQGGSDREVFDNMKNEEEGYEYDIEWTEKDEEGNWTLPRFSLSEINHDNRNALRKEAVKIILNAEKGVYSEEILEEVKKYIFFKSPHPAVNFDWKKQFFTKYPNLMTEEDIQSLSTSQNIEFVKNLPEKEQVLYKEMWSDRINNIIENPENLINDEIRKMIKERDTSTDIGTRASLDSHILTRLELCVNDDIISPLELFKPIPEPLIRKLVTFANNINSFLGKFINLKEENFYDAVGGYDRQFDNLKEKVDDTHFKKISFNEKIHTKVVFALNMSGSVTPTVQRYYASLLPLWRDEYRNNNSNININTLGSAIANLGENGRQFIPFIKQKIRETEEFRNTKKGQSIDPKLIDKVIERYLYILDAVESGTGRSSKYRFYENSNYKMANNWYNRTKDKLEKMLGLGKYEPKKKKKEVKRDGECSSSLDMHCDGTGDDGW